MSDDFETNSDISEDESSEDTVDVDLDELEKSLNDPDIAIENSEDIPLRRESKDLDSKARSREIRQVILRLSVR